MLHVYPFVLNGACVLISSFLHKTTTRQQWDDRRKNKKLSLAAAKLLLPVPFVDDFAPVPPCMFMDDFVADGDIAVPAILFLTAFFLAC